jgi:hypothetical protein
MGGKRKQPHQHPGGNRGRGPRGRPRR